MHLSFHGGVGEVTGACYLIEAKKTKILVDCGLFQGCAECDDWNFEPFGFDPASIDAVFVTHAHVDHIGRIPRLVKEGFRGRILSTPPTKDLAALLLEDTLHLSERENRKTKLWAFEDMERALARWEAVPYGTEVSVGSATAVFRNAGHILGSSFVEIAAEGKRILFTGDLGNTPSILLPPPDAVENIDYLVIESTYGARTHESAEERQIKVERAVEDAASRRGTLLVPAFAAERTQDLLHLINEMFHFRRVPEMPVFVDSPLAIKITGVFESYPTYYQEGVRALLKEHPNLFKFKRLKLTETVEESKAINGVPPPKVIIAGSGMMQGGRVLHHAVRCLPDSASILLLVGYQSAGSLGRRLVDGEQFVKILGQDVAVRAEIRQIGGFSAHADNPQLYSFVSALRDGLKHVFVVQGEDANAMHFMYEVRDRLGIPATAPRLHEKFEL